MTTPHCLAGIKAARIRTSTPVERLAAAIGISVTSYYRYENGSRRIYLDRACVLADLMGISLDELRRPSTDGTVVTERALADWEVTS